MTKKVDTSNCVKATVCGIPCAVIVTHFIQVPPWPGDAHTAPSDLDYYGYTEVEWELYDRKGYRAEWLEKKMTSKDRTELEMFLLSRREKLQ